MLRTVCGSITMNPMVMPDEPKEVDSKVIELYRAVRDGNADLVQQLLAQGVDPDQPNWNDNGRIPLLEAVVRQDPNIVKLLLSSCCSVDVTNFQGETALHLAIGTKPLSLEIIFMLLNAGADPGIPERLTGNTSLHTLVSKHVMFRDRADRSKVLEVLKCLVDQGDINARNFARCTVLHKAVSSSMDDELVAERVQVLLGAGAAVNAQNDVGETALHIAADGHLCHTAGKLIAGGADVNVTDRYQMVPLHYAASKNCDRIACLLIEHDSCDPNAADLNGDTALHLAAGKGHVAVAKVLTSSKKVDLNVPNAVGALPLHKAIESGFVDVVEELLNANCGILAHTGYALTPLDLACTESIYRARPEISKLLQGAAQNTVDECGPGETDI